MVFPFAQPTPQNPLFSFAEQKRVQDEAMRIGSEQLLNSMKMGNFQDSARLAGSLGRMARGNGASAPVQGATSLGSMIGKFMPVAGLGMNAAAGLHNGKNISANAAYLSAAQQGNLLNPFKQAVAQQATNQISGGAMSGASIGAGLPLPGGALVGGLIGAGAAGAGSLRGMQQAFGGGQTAQALGEATARQQGPRVAAGAVPQEALAALNFVLPGLGAMAQTGGQVGGALMNFTEQGSDFLGKVGDKIKNLF